MLSGLLVVGALLGCAEPGEAHGELVDALGGEVPADVGVVAIAVSGAPEACARIRASVDGGAFALVGLCPGERYRLVPDSPEWWAPEAPEVKGGEATTGLTVAAFHVPPEDGVSLLTGGVLTRLVSQAALDEIVPLDGSPALRIPTEVPSALPQVAGGWLVLSGAGVIARVTISPLTPTTRLQVGPAEAPRALDPWFALGPAVTPVHPRDLSGPPPPATVPTLTTGDAAHHVRLLAADALPAGDYVVAERDGRRGILVRFGSTP